MEVEKTAIPGVFVIKSRIFGDDRGYFFESFNERDFTQSVGEINFV